METKSSVISEIKFDEELGISNYIRPLRMHYTRVIFFFT